MSGTLRAAILGGSGYVGGELLRLLLGHPDVEIAQVISERRAGRPVTGDHPNLRGLTDLVYQPPEKLSDCDVVFSAQRHGRLPEHLGDVAVRAPLLIDLGADHRLRDADRFAAYYGRPLPAEAGTFVTGLPELYGEQIATADRIAVPGCMATAAILALHPLAAAGLVAGDVTVDARTGSSGSGTGGGAASGHPERSGAMRLFAPDGHRHEAEIDQATGVRSRMTATAVEAVRGVQVVAHVPVREAVTEPELRRLFRTAYRKAPFVRVVAYHHGLYRLPEPKILAGSNFCDVGFAVPPDPGRVVLCAALDNLVKGAAGNAVQCLNVRTGRPERTGLEFPGLHPV